MPRRFLSLSDVEDELSISPAQAYALVRSGQLRAIKIGGRGVWRVERTELEAFIAAAYTETARQIAADASESNDQNLR